MTCFADDSDLLQDDELAVCRPLVPVAVDNNIRANFLNIGLAQHEAQDVGEQGLAASLRALQQGCPEHLLAETLHEERHPVEQQHRLGRVAEQQLGVGL